MSSFVFAPFHDSPVSEADESAPRALVSLTAFVENREPEADGRAFAFDQRLVDVEFESRTVAEKLGKVLNYRIASDDRVRPASVYTAVGAQVCRRSMCVTGAPCFE